MRFRTLYLVLCGLLLATPRRPPNRRPRPAADAAGRAARTIAMPACISGTSAKALANTGCSPRATGPRQRSAGDLPARLERDAAGPYRAWIDHIVRRGMVVVYPRYQPDLKTPNADFLDNAAGASATPSGACRPASWGCARG